jgi:hypothetical protein
MSTRTVRGGKTHLGERTQCGLLGAEDRKGAVRPQPVPPCSLSRSEDLAAAERPHSTDPGRQPSRPAASTPRSTDPRQQELTGAGARPVGRKCDVLLLVTLGELPDPDGLGDDRLGDTVMYDGDIDGDGAGSVALRSLEDAVSQAVVPRPRRFRRSEPRSAVPSCRQRR